MDRSIDEAEASGIPAGDERDVSITVATAGLYRTDP